MSDEKKAETPPQPEPQPVKKPYEPPTVTDLGKVEEVTRGVGAGPDVSAVGS